MAVRVRQVTRTTQPQEAVGVARDNPLSSNLSAQYLPTRGDIVDSVKASSAGATFYGGSVTSVGPSGIGVKAVAYGSNAIGGDYVAIPASPENSLSAPLSWEILLSVGTLSSGAAFPIISGILTKDSQAARGCTLRFNPDATSGNYNVPCFIALDSGGNETKAIGVGASAGQLLHLVGTWDGTTATLWQNGVAYTATGARTIATGATVPLAINTDYLGDASNLNRSSDHLVYYVRIWSEAVSAAKVAALYSNPWQLFEPEQIVVNLGAATGPTYTLTAATGSFTLTGQSANLVVSRKLTATTGSFALTGQSANLVVSRKLTTETGTFTLTGQSTNLKVSRKLVAGTETFSLTGISANLVYTPVSGATYTLTAQTGVFNLTGQAAAFKVSRKLTAGTGVFYFVGNAANFYPGGVIPTTTKGGVGKGKNLTLKQKKKLKQVVNQEWLKAEQTAKELLYERLGHAEPAKTKVERLTTVQSLGDVIAALQALSKETVTLPEQQAVIKSFEKSIDTKIVKTGERLVYVEDKVNETLGRIEKKIQNLEDLLIVIIDDLL